MSVRSILILSKLCLSESPKCSLSVRFPTNIVCISHFIHTLYTCYVFYLAWSMCRFWGSSLCKFLCSAFTASRPYIVYATLLWNVLRVCLLSVLLKWIYFQGHLRRGSVVSDWIFFLSPSVFTCGKVVTEVSAYWPDLLYWCDIHIACGRFHIQISARSCFFLVYPSLFTWLLW